MLKFDLVRLATVFLLLPGFSVHAQDLPPAEPPAESHAEPMVQTLTPLDLFARDSYRIDTVVCPFKGEIEYEPGDIECGLLEVPENREDPDSRFIELHFVKLNSRWGKDDDEDSEEDKDDSLPPGKRDDAVIYLTGGPGAKVNYYVNRLKDHTLLKHRDLYILEQRGIGFSDDFCPYYSIRKPATDDVETFDEQLLASHQRKEDCATNATASGVDLTGYSTIENARDVKALRRALGYEQWNVWGISYGSILGQAYIKEDPEGILAVALDAIMPLEIRESELYWRVAHWYNRDLEKLQEICQGQPACAKHYPDIGARIREAVKSVVDNPIEVEVKDIENYPSGKARIFQDIVAFLPFIFFYEQDNYPGIPGLIYAWADAVESRDETLFKAIASAAGGGFGDSSQGMSNAIFCLDGDEEAQARAGLKDLQEYPVLGAAIGSAESYERGVELCLKMGMPQRPAEEFSAVRTDIPSLIIEGDMDPITPPPNARAILPGFENGTYVEFPYAGHGPSRSVKCAGSLLNKFYDNPTAEPDLSCVDEMEEPEIWAPLYTTSIAPRLLVLAVEDKKKLAIPGAWAGLSVLVLLIAFLVLTFQPLGRALGGPALPEAGNARVAAWTASLLSVASVAVFASAIAVTAEASEMLLAFGIVPWAVYGAWLGLFGGLVGLITVAVTFRTLFRQGLPPGTWFGFVLTGLAAISLSAFMLSWGLGPF
jgi:pimeloyl-ACP methyl ester carboxylesterase